ncbi:hypothetical protein AgCh_033874 [Apium graveolens]
MENQKELKHLELKQNNFSVVEYEAKFIELSSFVREFVNTKEKKLEVTIAEAESEQIHKEREKGWMKRKSMSVGGGSGGGNFSRLPLDTEIEFAIELAPGTVPVSKAPYQLAPLEMKKLATQLQELLEEGNNIGQPLQDRGSLKLGKANHTHRGKKFYRIFGYHHSTEKDDKGIMRYSYRIWVPNVQELKDEILDESHSLRYSIHSGSTKMYRDLKEYYWWPNMKREVAEWVSRCLTFQRVKAEHHRHSGLLRPLEISEWKWE